MQLRRLLSQIKRRVTPGPWVKQAKKRRPVTLMSELGPHGIFDMPVNPTPNLRKLNAARLRPPEIVHPPCDTDAIIEIYLDRKSVARADSDTLPLWLKGPPAPSREALATYRFINFEPAYVVTVEETQPYRLQLRKPRAERLSQRLSSFFGASPWQTLTPPCPTPSKMKGDSANIQMTGATLRRTESP